MVLKDKRDVGERDLATVSRHQVSHQDPRHVSTFRVVVGASCAATSPSSKRRDKVCRIVEEKNEYYDSPPLTVEDIAHQWYRMEEWKEMKSRKAKLAQHIIVADELSKNRVTFQSILSKVFRRCCKAQAEEDMTEQQQQPPQDGILSEALFSCLARTLKEVSPGRRTGMECHAVPMVAIRQQVYRKELWSSMELIQRHRHIIDVRKIEECLRLSSEFHSRPSRLYATLVAQANAAILMEE